MESGLEDTQLVSHPQTSLVSFFKAVLADILLYIISTLEKCSDLS